MSTLNPREVERTEGAHAPVIRDSEVYTRYKLHAILEPDLYMLMDRWHWRIHGSIAALLRVLLEVVL